MHIFTSWENIGAFMGFLSRATYAHVCKYKGTIKRTVVMSRTLISKIYAFMLFKF